MSDLLYATYSQAIYGTSDDVVAWCERCGRGWEFRTYLHENGTDCFICSNVRTHHAFVGFRGTETNRIEDVVTDLKTYRINFGHGKVHKGFHEGVGSVWNTLVEELLTLRDEGYKLGITGHSLGAGEANDLAVRLLEVDDGHIVEELVTFGCPRWADAPLAGWLDAKLPGNRIRRYVNNNDIVARIPLPGSRWLSVIIPFWWMLPVGFKHTHGLVYINAEGNITGDLGKWSRFVDRLKGRWFAGRNWLSDGRRDHDIQHYINALSGEEHEVP